MPPGRAKWAQALNFRETYPCIPEDAQCGYTVMMELRDKVPPGVMAYANYGKGVTFWQTREQAERFVNDFQRRRLGGQLLVHRRQHMPSYEGGVLKNNGDAALSPSECRLAANYGLTTRHVRSLVQPSASMPVWNFIELGNPFADGKGGTITAPQMRAAVWSSIINGARGIIYFAHNFGGPCRLVQPSSRPLWRRDPRRVDGGQPADRPSWRRFSTRPSSTDMLDPTGRSTSPSSIQRQQLFASRC